MSPNVSSFLEFISYDYSSNNVISMVQKYDAERENRCEDLTPTQCMFQGE